MPAIVANAKNFKFSSDFPADIVAYLPEIPPITVASGGFVDTVIPHTLGFAPLLQGQWTDSPTWTYAYDENAGPAFPNGVRQVQTSIESTASNITIRISNNTAGSKTIYWRIYGFMPSDVDVDVPPTANLADPFILNTDYNYTKLYLNGVTGSTSTLGSTEVISHDLGYRPQVLVWGEYASGYTYWTGSYALTGAGGSTFVSVSNSNVTITRDATFLTSAIRFHYRIYVDEQ